MKNLTLTLGLLFLAAFSFSQSKSNLQGENLDLYATLNLFESSESIEDFENKLNSEKNDVNNLDLNNDGFVDYIRVVDHTEGNIHAITMQVPFPDGSNQDVAVIEVDKVGDNTTAQIVGDPKLYGENAIIEPKTDSPTKASNVSHWKPIRKMYLPTYVTWTSPFRYNHHPKLYKRRKPITYSVYRARHTHHHNKYRKVSIFRSTRAHNHSRKHKVNGHQHSKKKAHSNRHRKHKHH